MSEMKTAKPVVISHYVCPHCNALDSMVVQKIDDKEGFCVECFKPFKMEEESND